MDQVVKMAKHASRKSSRAEQNRAAMESMELSNKNRASDEKTIEKEGQRRRRTTSFFSLFAMADSVDWLLMLFGSIGACLHGAATPFFLVLFGHIIDSLGSLALNPQKLASEVSERQSPSSTESIKVVEENCNLNDSNRRQRRFNDGVILMPKTTSVFSLMTGFPVNGKTKGVAFWMQTGERQVARLRLKYLQSVLRKDINFFDMEARDANILFHISSDAILVQDAIGDKVGHCLRYLAQFVVGFAVGFTILWKVTLVTLAVIPLLVVAGGAYTIIMSTLSRKGEAAYAESGKVAEEVISQVRTVYSFVGEDKAVESYSKSLESALKLGKKSGVAKGLGVGATYGLLFAAWAFLLWYAGNLVRNHLTNGGKAFTTVINVIFSGFALGQAAPNLSAISKGQAAASNILSMMDGASKSSKSRESGMVFSKVEGKIEFCKVSFAYPSRPNKVLEDLSFSISAGKTFAVVGPSGSGKSTIISLVERFYDPTSGCI
ncbi:hypothetical protein ACLOJK_028038 [Asimina triloba]